MSKHLRLLNSLAVFMILFGVVTTSIASTGSDEASTSCVPPAVE